MLKKTIFIISTSLMLSLLGIINVFAGTWKSDNHGWWYQNHDYSYPHSQWLNDGGKWYYFHDNGYMATGWVSTYGKWYYLGADGAMLANTTTPDGYPVGADGAWIQNNLKKEALQAYAAFLSTYTADTGQDPTFTTVYIDQDDIPELLIFDGSWHGAGGRVHTYYNGAVAFIGEYGEYGSFRFYEKKNVMEDLYFWNGMKSWHHSWHSIRDGKEYVIISSDGYNDYDNESNNKYSINNELVSEEAYDKAWEVATSPYNIVEEATMIQFNECHKLTQSNINSLLYMD